ncbi:MarR family winged helix-turn-helix transcriptional regulator [Marinactinospora rubrisoli]|uniref:MarR family winged helix-turn-helix transcriptional regulator n=1 Tax=Marinactinospora rubrisoli TaxID=2715399 RepID=A0ABW2KLA3_9ACTN
MAPLGSVRSWPAGLRATSGPAGPRCRLDHTRQSVQRVADLLVEDGLARYRPDPAHQRAELLELTPTGRAALHRMEAAYTRLALRTTKGLDPDGLELARETLSELQRRLESEPP